MSTTPTGNHELRDAERIEAGDVVWIEGRWQTVEAAGAWPTGQPDPQVELTTEPHSEGHTFDPKAVIAVQLPSTLGRFVLEITPGNEAMTRGMHVAVALRDVAAKLDPVTDWEGEGIVRDGNGNTVGRWTFHDHN